MKRLKQRLTLKSNQSNDDWYRNVFKRRPKVSRDDVIDQTGKTTAISVTMLITIAKTVSDGLEEDWLLLLPCTFVHCRMMASLHPCWIGTGPPDTNCQSPVWGSSSTSGGLNPPPPPTNRTLCRSLCHCDGR